MTPTTGKCPKSASGAPASARAALSATWKNATSAGGPIIMVSRLPLASSRSLHCRQALSAPFRAWVGSSKAGDTLAATRLSRVSSPWSLCVFSTLTCFHLFQGRFGMHKWSINSDSDMIRGKGSDKVCRYPTFRFSDSITSANEPTRVVGGQTRKMGDVEIPEQEASSQEMQDGAIASSHSAASTYLF